MLAALDNAVSRLFGDEIQLRDQEPVPVYAHGQHMSSRAAPTGLLR